GAAVPAGPRWTSNPEEPPGLAALADVADRVLFTPHMAWYTEQSEADLRRKAAFLQTFASRRIVKTFRYTGRDRPVSDPLASLGRVHRLSRIEARRIAVRAQLLDAQRPTHLIDAVRHLTLLQVDQTAAVAPSAHLVAWSRLGPAYVPDELDVALGEGPAPQRALVELEGMIRPAEDVALYRAEMADW